MAEPLLEVRDLTCLQEKGIPIFSKLNFVINERDIVVVQGKSGSGKTTLLKCLAHLNVYEGQILYRGRNPKSYDIPTYRTRVLYVPQRPSLLPGTPRDFVDVISSFSSRKKPRRDHAFHTNLERTIGVAKAWGVDEELWDRSWSNLSGGESQRIALAVAIGLNTAEIVLLDEPTSALDPQSSDLVEQTLASELRSSDSVLKAMVWITHSEEQAHRVGTRHLHISSAGCQEESPVPEV